MHFIWPYPRWIAHRGSGRLAPENTLAAFRLGAQHGYRMFECDVKLSADGVPFLLHDATLERTTNAASALPAGASLSAGAHHWSVLRTLDAGGWHSPAYRGEPMPTLEAVAGYCLSNRLYLNIEIKPTPGSEVITGTTVAHWAKRLWADTDTPPLLSSFSTAALAAAQAAVPSLPRGLLLDEPVDDWRELARGLACVAVISNYTLAKPGFIAAVHAAGMRSLCYTVNDAATATGLQAAGIDGIITDRVDMFPPDPAAPPVS